MTKAHSAASKRRWENVPDTERTKRMRALIKKRWEKTTPEQRKKILKRAHRAHTAKAKARRLKK